MIYPGQFVHTTISCPECGKPMSNGAPKESQFYLCYCREPNCSGVHMLIEKNTSMVIWTSNTYYRDGDEWKPAFPMLADKDGNQVWPKKD